jgi:hypothetical protein
MAAVATRDDVDLAADETDNSDAHLPLVGPENSRVRACIIDASLFIYKSMSLPS